jgi:hypothetical protein
MMLELDLTHGLVGLQVGGSHNLSYTLCDHKNYLLGKHKNYLLGKRQREMVYGQ